jgi:hypothetical protein
MDAIPADLSAAARAARERLLGFSRDAAVASARGNRNPSAPMAQAAREAIFADALLAAMHARLEELKSVAK